ncbi:MAG: S8 family serine peptidase, partial [Thiothrix sp.]
YKVIGKTVQNEVCQINHQACIETHVFEVIDYEKNELLITYDSNTPTEAADDVLRKYKLRAKRTDDLGSIKTTMITAATNGQDPKDLQKVIKKNEKDVDAHLNNYYTTVAAPAGVIGAYPLGLTGIGAARQHVSGRGITIGMIDTPIDIDHESLRSAIDRVDLVPPGDERNRLHGTEVAGIMISRNPRIGIAPEAKLVAVSAFSTSPQNPDERRSNSGLVARALEIVMKKGVNVLNLSFAGKPDPVVDQLVQAAVQRGITVVASAGNNGPGAPPAYPAALPGVIAVTAVDKGERLFSGANRGEYIDLAAPGVGILTTAPRGAFHVSSGTSLATAHVSGAIALLKSLNPGFTPDVFNRTAIDLGTPGRDNDYGYGLININRAMGIIGAR